MSKKILSILLMVIMVVSLAACGQEAPAGPAESSQNAPTQSATPAPETPEPEDDKLVVGFAQIGQESGWRDAETWSILNAAEELGVDLKFSDGQQKQENQIKAIRTFIQQGVDVIGVAPVVETGWETVFKEAKDAGIPIVLVDRRAAVSEDLYATFIGSDFIVEGQNACKEMARLLNEKGSIVELQGTVGASAATDRMEGFKQELANHPGMKIIASQTGDFTRAKGKEVMEAFLKAYPGQINGVYGHNDDMVLGAIEAIKDAGLKPGVDIKTVSVDGVKGLFEAMVAGEANVTVECNPLLGPQLFQICKDLKEGKEVPKWVKSEEGVYRQETAAEDIKTRKY